MNNVINKFYKLGVVSMQALEEYFEDILKTNSKIENLLKSLSITRHVNYIDRENFKTWTEEWKMPEALIDYAATLAKGKDNPIKYLSRVLADWHSKAIMTVEEAKQNIPIEKPALPQTTLKGRSYSKDEINALFESIDDVEI